MSFYQNTDCPVCHKQFCEDDVIVTCPVCGTPHHKECYNEIGHCVNHNLHKAGYDYIKEHKSNAQQSGSVFNVNQEYYQSPENKGDNLAQNKGDQSQKADDNQTPQSMPNPFNMLGANTISTPFDKDKSTISGKSVADVAVGIGSNAIKFVDIFKSLENGKKFVWNWCAFFFGSFYFFARKMYKQAIAFISLEFATLYTAFGCINKFAPTYSAFMANVASGTEQTAFDVKKFDMILQSEEGMLVATIGYAMLGVLLLIHVIEALFANRIYKSTIISNINKVEKMMEDGKDMPSPIMFYTAKAPTTDDLKKLQIARKGGLNIFAPFAAYFTVEMIMMTITFLFQ